MLAGSSEEQMKEFRKKQRKEASHHFDKRVADLKEKMKEQAIEFSSDGQQINGQQINGGGYGGGRGGGGYGGMFPLALISFIFHTQTSYWELRSKRIHLGPLSYPFQTE